MIFDVLHNRKIEEKADGTFFIVIKGRRFYFNFKGIFIKEGLSQEQN